MTKSSNEEIELKIKLGKYETERMILWLSKNANFKDEIIQEEYYLDNPEDSWFITHELGYRYALKYLRVRFTKKGDYVCHKDWETEKLKERQGFSVKI